jgi:phytoene dehydrogenase-like protein
MRSPSSPGSGYVLLHHVMGELEGVRGAWGYPEGGMGAVSGAIAKAALAAGAQIFTQQEAGGVWSCVYGFQRRFCACNPWL